MALPPLIDSGITSDDMIPTEASVEVPVEAQAEMFPNGAEVMPDGEGGAISPGASRDDDVCGAGRASTSQCELSGVFR